MKKEFIRNEMILKRGIMKEIWSKALPFITSCLVVGGCTAMVKTWQLASEIPEVKKEIVKMESKIDILDSRVDKLDSRIGKVEVKIDHILTSISELKSLVNPQKVSLKNTSDSN